MAFKTTKWELSEISDDEIQQAPQFANFTDGLHIVKITEASYVDEDTAEDPALANTYKVSFESVGEDGAKASVRYFVKNKERTAYNSNVLGTLNSLGKAVFGPEFIDMVPAPVDIIGAVVGAEIKMSPVNNLGKSYPRVYHWVPVPDAYSIYSNIEQYYTQQQVRN